MPRLALVDWREQGGRPRLMAGAVVPRKERVWCRGRRCTEAWGRTGLRSGGVWGACPLGKLERRRMGEESSPR
nr:unnamed protein product [Digitaria exilis]